MKQSFICPPPGPRRTAAILLAMACLGTARLAAAHAPAPPDLHLKLANGLRLRILRRRGAPVASLALRLRAGSREDRRGQAGVAHVVARWVFAAAPPPPLAIYGRVNYRVRPDTVIASQTVALAALPVLLRQAAQWLRAPTMAGFAPARAAALARERRQWRIPYARLLHVGLPLAVFPGWPDRHAAWGNAFDLAHLTAGEALAFNRRYYVAANAVLAVVTPNRRLPVLRLARRVFQALPHRPRPSRPSRRLPRPVKERQFAMHDPAAHWPAMAIAWPGPRRRDRAYPAAALLGWMLFHGSHSRAAQALVQRRQDALAVTGGLGFPLARWLDYHSPGVMGALAVYPPGKHSALIEALLFREIHEISVNGITSLQFAQAQAGVEADWWRARQTAGGLARQWSQVHNSKKHLGLMRFLRVQPRDVVHYDQQFLVHARTTLLVDVPTPALPSSAPKPRPAAPYISATPAASAAAALPPPVPDYAPPRPDSDHFPNGLRVRIVRLPGVPLAAVRLAVAGGKAYQPAPGLAAADAALMSAGARLSAGRTAAMADAASLQSAAAAAGGRLTVRAGYDSATIAISGLASDLPQMLHWTAMLARRPVFPAAAVATYAAATHARLPGLDQPAALARALLAREIFRGTPYGAIFAPVKITQAQLAAFHRSVWLPNNHAVLVIAGNVSRAAAHNLAQKYFGDWRYGYPPRPKWRRPARPAGLNIILVNRPQARHAVAMLGMPGPDRDDPGFRALLAATRAAQSRLRARFPAGRHEVRAYCDPLGHAGAWIAEFRFPTTRTAPRLRRALADLTAMPAQWNPSDLAWAGRQLAARFLLSTQSAPALADRLLVPALFPAPLSYLSTYIHHIQSVSPARAAAAWRRYVRPQQATLVVVGDAAQLRAGLARLAPPGHLILWNAQGQSGNARSLNAPAAPASDTRR